MLMGSIKPDRGPRLEKAKVCNERPRILDLPSIIPAALIVSIAVCTALAI
jgi:hypothetical protein